MNDTCEIVRDLIPLCEDKVASPATQRYIAEHIKTCESCRKLVRPKKLKTPALRTDNCVSSAVPDYNKIAKKITHTQRAAFAVASGLILLLTAYDIYLSVCKNFPDRDSDRD